MAESPDISVQVLSRDEPIHSATSSSLASVRFYTLEKQERQVIVYSRIPRPLNTTSQLLEFAMKPCSEFKPLVEFQVINSLDLSRPGSKPQAFVLLKMPDSVAQMMNDGLYAFNDTRFDRIHSWLVTARMLRNYGNVIYSSPKTITINEPVVLDRVDLAQFKFRDLTRIADSIRDPVERNAFKNVLKHQFVETTNEGVPDYEDRFTRERTYGLEDANYITFKIPVFAVEKHMLEIADEYFSQLYVHPRKLLELYKYCETDITRIAPECYARAYSANVNIRVPNPIQYTVDVSEYYQSTNAIKELITQMDSLVVITIMLRNFALELNSLQLSMRTSTLNVSGVENINACINTSGLSRLVDAIFRVNINPNLYVIDIRDIGNDLWRTPSSLIALRTFVSFIPATALIADQRRMMNNLAAHNILQTKLKTPQFKYLADTIRNEAGIDIPDVAASTQWASAEIDLLQVVYYYGRHVLNTGSYEVVKTLIRLYYNDVDETTNNGVVELSTKEKVPMSLCTPYYTGLSPTHYHRDHEYDAFRKQRHMHPNGVLCMNPQTDYMQAADATVLRRILEFATLFYGNRGTARTIGTGLSGDQINVLLNMLEMNGLERVLMLPRIFNSMRPNFSTNIVADGIIRPVDVLRRVYITADSRFMTTAFFMIDPSANLHPRIDINIQRGATIAYTMQIYRTLYHRIQNEVGLLAGTYVSQAQLMIITTTLIRIFFGEPDFDPKVMFGYEDAAQWKRFLKAPPVPIEEIPLLNHFMKLILRFEPLLRDERLTEIIVPRFFLVAGAYSTMKPPALACNSVPRSRLKVMLNIRSAQHYEELMGDYQTDGIDYSNAFDKLWYDQIHLISPEDQMSNDTPIPAIRVNMNVRVLVDVIREDGTFPMNKVPVGSNIMEFHEFMNASTNDIRKAPMLSIKHTVIVNDVGSYSRPDPMHIARRRDSMISRLPRLCMIVPSADLPVPLLTMQTLLDRLNNSVTFRRDSYTLWNDFKINVIRAHNLPN